MRSPPSCCGARPARSGSVASTTARRRRSCIGESQIHPEPNGPLQVRGRLRIVDAEGNVVREMTRASLCRCGHSRRKPFCDNSHRLVNFRAD